MSHDAEVHLGTLKPAWRKLARTAQAGREARSALLSDGERAARMMAIRQYHAALQQRQEHRDSVLAAARILARTEHPDQAHQQAAHDFETGLRRDKTVTERLTALGNRAANARAELKEDDTARAAKKPILDAGDEAEEQLEGLLRGHLAEALSERSLLPVWFVTALGPVPSGEKNRGWWNLAAAILAYRAAYEITDPLVTLGAHPTGDAGLRIAWYEELTQALRRWS